MKIFCFGIVCFCVLAQTDAMPIQSAEDPYREPSHLPYWPFTNSDFWAYVEYFRTLGAYHRINEMAKTFFAQHPLGSTFGYNVPDHEY